MSELLPEKLPNFLDALADAVGWHRLKEFLDLLDANPGLIDDLDPPDESIDMFQEMHRLQPNTESPELFRWLKENAELVARHVDDHL